MYVKNHILSSGISQLCESDSLVNSLITPRRDEILCLLDKYTSEIELFNPALGLVGTGDRQELTIKHILDSLAPLTVILRYIRAGTYPAAAGHPRIADIGSGAGLPGIPLAIVLPHIEFTLVERMARRTGFLRNTQAVLGLSNVVIEEAEMEKAQPGRFNIITFRAFKPLTPDIIKPLFRLCANGGILAAYKGRRAKTEAEITKLQPLLDGRYDLIPYPVPMLDEERHLLMIHSGSTQ